MRSSPAPQLVAQLCYDTSMGATTFITIRELRNQTKRVFETLGDSTGVVTSNGKPVGVLLSLDEDLDSLVESVRQVRAVRAVSRLRAQAKDSGAANLDAEEIGEEIRKTRER